MLETKRDGRPMAGATTQQTGESGIRVATAIRTGTRTPPGESGAPAEDTFIGRYSRAHAGLVSAVNAYIAAAAAPAPPELPLAFRLETTRSTAHAIVDHAVGTEAERQNVAIDGDTYQLLRYKDRLRREISRRPPGRCDYCGTDLGRRHARYACADFTRTMPAGPGHDIPLRLLGYWAACIRCDPMVADRAWSRLINRVMRVYLARHGRLDPHAVAVVRTEFISLWMASERHLTGERVLVDEGRSR